MPISNLYEQYPPLPHILWQIDTPKSFPIPKTQTAKDKFSQDIKKAFRYYIEIISFYHNLQDIPIFKHEKKEFQQSNWREYLSDILADKTIKELLLIFNVDTKKWLDEFKNGSYCRELTQEVAIDILNLVPFDLLHQEIEKKEYKIRTFNNDFPGLAERGFLGQNKEEKKYYKLSFEAMQSRFRTFVSSSDLDTELQNVLYDDLLTSTAESLKDEERFFIKFQHIINKNNLDKVGDIIAQLKQNWQQTNSLIMINYQSSSQQKELYLIIYPITLFYNQRAIYLTGYGPTPSHETKINYYNYRLDHLTKLFNNQYIFPVDWDDTKYLDWKQKEDPNDEKLPYIHYELVKYQDNIKEWRQEQIYNQLSQGLGIDLERKIQTMLLRFPQQFHQDYIQDSQRHETFQRLDFKNDPAQLVSKLKAKLCDNQPEITPEDQDLIKRVVKANPKDAYYTMNYRHGESGGYNVESDVIMRLRAWGHNVEVLYPADLRNRIKEDYQKAWDIYQK
jgi:CRISPR-associated protein (TIGR03985 family)